MEAPKKQPMEYDSNPFTLSFKGFGLLLDYAKGVFIAMLVFSLIGFVFNVAAEFIPDSSESQTSQLSEDDPFTNNELANDINQASVDEDDAAMVVIFILLAVAIGSLVVVAVSTVFTAAYKGFVAAGAVAAGQKRTITAGEAFSEMGGRFGTLYLAELIAVARIIGGYLLFIVPGIRAQLRYQSTPYILMGEKSLSATQGIARSKELYKGHLMEVFGIMTVGAIIPVIGNAISSSGMALSTQQITAYHAAGAPTPKTHWLNYLGLILIGLGLLLVIGLVLLVIAAFANL